MGAWTVRNIRTHLSVAASMTKAGRVDTEPALRGVYSSTSFAWNLPFDSIVATTCCGDTSELQLTQARFFFRSTRTPVTPGIFPTVSRTVCSQFPHRIPSTWKTIFTSSSATAAETPIVPTANNTNKAPRAIFLAPLISSLPRN